MKLKLSFLFILFLLSSCKKEITHRYLQLASFDQIELNDAFEVFLSEANNASAEIIGYENIIGHIDLKVENNILSIANNKNVKWLSPGKNKIMIYINSPPLKKIVAAEGCNIQTLTPITSEEFGLILTGKANEATLELGVNTFYYWNNIPCGGKLTLSGKAETLKIWNFALMSVDAKSLTSKNAIVENSSAGDCEVNVLNKLEYSIKGKGNIHLYGTPLEIIENGSSASSDSGILIKH